MAAGEPPAPPVQFTADHKRALLDVQARLEQDDYSNRLEIVRRIRKAREFWKGNQYLWWSETEMRFKTLSIGQGLTEEEEDDVFQYVTNIYQGYGLTLMSVVSQSRANVRFFPQDNESAMDVATADAASPIAEHIDRRNKMDEKQVREALYMWTDGTYGFYVRSVEDAERFGTTVTPVMGERPRQITPDVLRCATCAWATELPEGAVDQAAADPAAGFGPCPVCNAPMTVDNVDFGEVAMEPYVKDQKVTPNSEVVVDVISALEMRLPSYAGDLESAGYLIYATEMPKAKIEAVYPEMQGKLSESEIGPTDTEERRIRLSLTTEGRASNTMAESTDILTFKRTWLRPWQLNSVKDSKLRDELKQLFPSGVFFASVGSAVCEARNESLDKHWVLVRPIPGDGADTPSVGGSLISVQERYNTLSNIEVDTHEHGIPTNFVDNQAMNMQAWKKDGNRPGLTWPIQTRPGLPAQAQFFQTEPAKVSPQIPEHRRELMGEVAQFLTGLFPALFGGGAIGNDTAAGYAMQRDQAMGRIGIIWRAIKRARANVAQLEVENFLATKSGEQRLAVMNELGHPDTRLINLDSLKGGFLAFPEANEDFPMTWTQKRNSIQEVINSPLVNTLQTPKNMDAVGRTLGPIGLEFPGAQARRHALAEIVDLVKSAPMMQEVPAADPMTGAPNPMLPPVVQPQPTIEVDKELDDHQSHMLTHQEWSESPEGRRCRTENPQGFLNQKLHFMQHQAAFAEQQAAQAAAQAAANPKPEQKEEGGPQAA